MNDGGFAMYPNLDAGHWVYQKSEREALWAYMCRMAAPRDREAHTSKGVISLKRGQLVFGSESYAAMRGEKEVTVRRTVKRLEDDGLIDRVPTPKGSVITVCYIANRKRGDGESDEQSDGEMTGRVTPIKDVRSSEVKTVDKGTDLKAHMSSGERPDDVKAVIAHLNEAIGSRYKASTKAHADGISARLGEGYSPADLMAVIDHKTQEWGRDPKMAQYLRPATLFAPGKFAGYLLASKTRAAPMAYSTTTARNIETLRDWIPPT